MFKKTILILFVICNFCFVQIASAVKIKYVFDPSTDRFHITETSDDPTNGMKEDASGNIYCIFDTESSPFCHMDTISTWVANRHQQNSAIMFNVQGGVATSVLENPAHKLISKKAIHSITRRASSFGYVLPTYKSLELPFLQFAHEVSTRKKPITVEFAAGAGTFSWKPFLSWGKESTHYANELSHTMMYNEFTETIEKHSIALNLNILSSVVKLPGSCFNILDEIINLNGTSVYKDSIYSFAHNGFSPEIYRRAIALHPTLQLIDSFFVFFDGSRYKGEIYQDPGRAVAIVEKEGVRS